MSEHNRALLAEAAGTFWFFFIGAGAIIADANGSGGGLGAIALRSVFDFALAAIDKTHLGTPALANGVSAPVGIGVEALLTIFLVWAVYGTAVSPLAPRIAGFGIGLTVATDILMGGPLTGAAMNPARHFATAVPAGFYDNWYVYWIGPLLGAAIGGLSIRFLFTPPEADRPAM